MISRLFFAPLLKVDENDDGTLKVTGIASSEAEDAVGEIVKSDAMKAALPDYFKFGTGALREMHTLSAAGTVDEAEVDGDKTYIAATVVDPVAIEKVRKGVYKGFSIGGRVKARDPNNKNVITKLSLTEISLVDRPCNPEARFDVWKADGADESLMPRKKTPEAEIAAEPAAGEANNENIARAEGSPGAVTAEVGAAPEASEPEAATTDDAVAKANAVVDKLATAVAEAKSASVAKGMYEVANFAGLLSCVANLMKSTQYEAEYEGDNSPIPEQLRGWLADGVTIFKAMSNEETTELLATVKKASDTLDLAKAAPEAAGGDPATADADALAKATEAADALRKRLADKDEAITALAAKVEPLIHEVGLLRKRFEDEPLPAKTAKPHAIAKSADSVGAASPGGAPAAVDDPAVLEEVSKAFYKLPSEERALLLMKATHQFPHVISHRPNV